MLRAAPKAKTFKAKVAKKAPLKQRNLKRGLKTAAVRKTAIAPAALAPVSQSARAMSGVPDNGWVEGPKGVKRPISPSIQIWKFSPVAYMHVGSRVAGCILAGGMTVAGLYAATVGCDIPAALDAIKIHAPILVPLLKMSIVMPMAYHGLSGARQLYQDFTAKGYDAEFQEKSSYAIAGATAAATLYLGLAV